MQRLSVQLAIAIQQATIHQKIQMEIVAREKTEALVRESQGLLQKVADLSPSILYLYDMMAKRYVYVSSAIANILGITPEEVQVFGPKFINYFVHRDDLPRLAEHWQQLSRTQDGEILELEYCIRNAFGEWRWFSSRHTVFRRDANGQVVQIVRISAIAPSSPPTTKHQPPTTNQHLMNTSNSSILVIDDEPDNFDVIETLLSQQNYQLHYAASGQQAIDSLEWHQPDLILLDLMMPEIDGIQVCRQIKSMPKLQFIPIIMVTALDSKADLARCLNAGADDFISKPINALELRARINSMLRIKQQYEDLQTLLNLREDLVQMLIHDLRNPITGILLNVEILKSPNFPKEKHLHKLEQIYNSAKILESLVNDLLQITLIESGKLKLNCTQIEISHLIESALDKFEAIANQKNLSLIKQLPQSSPLKILVDVPMFQRTIDNILANAIKFSPRNSEIILKVESTSLAPLSSGKPSSKPSGSIKIQVIDFGPGVPDELQKAIFEKYEIGTIMPKISQIGLGLAFCKMVVQAHQGEITVRKNHPKGAIFEINLPLP